MVSHIIPFLQEVSVPPSSPLPVLIWIGFKQTQFPVQISQSSCKQPARKFEKLIVTAAGRLQERALVRDRMAKQ